MHEVTPEKDKTSTVTGGDYRGNLPVSALNLFTWCFLLLWELLTETATPLRHCPLQATTHAITKEIPTFQKGARGWSGPKRTFLGSPVPLHILQASTHRLYKLIHQRKYLFPSVLKLPSDCPPGVSLTCLHFVSTSKQPGAFRFDPPGAGGGTPR